MSAEFFRTFDQRHQALGLEKSFDPITEEEILKGLNGLLLWVPVTPAGYSVIVQAVALIEHLKNCNKQITEDPYLKLRKFAEEMLKIIPPDHISTPPRAKQIFFYNYLKGEVHLGYPACLNQELPPIVMVATMGSEVASSPCVELTLDAAIAATKNHTDLIQSRVFGMPLQPELVSNPEVDWEFMMRIGANPFESAFMLDFVLALKGLRVRNPETVYETFKDKFNLSRILNSSQRTQMDLRVFCVKAEVHWEWVKSE